MEPRTAPPATGFVPLAGHGRIAYTICGRADDREPPLLLLRPLGGSMLLWTAGGFRERLASRRRVISFDPRGAGRSSAPPFGMTTRDMAQDALAVLDHLGVDQAELFGLSLGGMVASWVAASSPSRVRRLILGSTARRGLDISRHGFGRALSLGRCLLRPKMADVEACLVHRILSARFRSAHGEALRQLEQLARQEPSTRTGLLALVAAAAMHDADRALHKVSAPALLLFGDLDPLLRADARSELAQALPTARVEMIASCGHDLSLEQPLLTADRIDAFLSA